MLRQLAVFLAVSVVVYLALVVMSLTLGGNGVSCDHNCTATQEWFADAHPLPMLVAGFVAIAAGLIVARRWPR